MPAWQKPSPHPAPGGDQFQEIWGRWNAKQAVEQSTDSIAANQRFLDKVLAISPEQRESWRLELSGNTHSLLSLLRLRLGEGLAHLGHRRRSRRTGRRRS
jgi:hypothetical protein